MNGTFSLAAAGAVAFVVAAVGLALYFSRPAVGARGVTVASGFTSGDRPSIVGFTDTRANYERHAAPRARWTGRVPGLRSWWVSRSGDMPDLGRPS